MNNLRGKMAPKRKDDKTTAAPAKQPKAAPAREATAGSEAAGPSGTATTKLSKSATILQRVVHALRLLGTASSSQAIAKTVASECAYDDATKVRKAIKQGVASGALQTSAESAAKFWIGGEAVPAGAVAPGVSIHETAEGAGEPVALGDCVAINYELSLAASETKVVESGKKFAFQVGAGDVIKGMDAGVLGLRLGGKRTVTVPWALGYGKRGSGADIPPCADLVFRISLVSIKRE